MRRFVYLLWIGWVCLCEAGALAAQEDAPLLLNPDTPREVTVVNGAPVALVYRADGPWVITVSARSLVPGALDTLLTVEDASGALLALNDDRDVYSSELAESDALIAELRLPNAGEYRVIVRTFDGHGTGAVEVRLVARPPDLTDAEMAAANTGMDSYYLAVPVNDVRDQPVRLIAGQQVTMTAHAITAGFDPILELIDPSLNIIASNDNHLTNNPTLGSQDAEISGSVIAATGTYVVRVHGVGGAGGDVQVVISRTLAPQSAVPVTIPLREDIIDDGIIGVAEVYERSFVAEAGDLITISAVAGSPSLDVRVALLNLAKQLIDSGERVDVSADAPARIERLIIRQGGTYVVQVMGYLQTSGDFTLTIRHLARGVPLGAPATETVRGETLQDGVFTLPLEAQAGDYVSVTARALTPPFDPRVYLRTAEGELLAMNDDHGSADPALALLDARIRHFPIAITGTYVIEVDSYDGSPGAFEVTAARLSTPRRRP